MEGRIAAASKAELVLKLQLISLADTDVERRTAIPVKSDAPLGRSWRGSYLQHEYNYTLYIYVVNIFEQLLMYFLIDERYLIFSLTRLHFEIFEYFVY